MRKVIVSTLVLSALVALTGCGASRAQAMRHPVASSETASDVSLNPPEQMEFHFSSIEHKSLRSTIVAGALPAPNRREVARGQLHAAY